MLKTILPLTFVAALGFGAAAQANTETGVIASVNTVGDTVTLTDGTTYGFGNEAYAERLGTFRPGDTVSIAYLHVGSGLEATSISPVTSGAGYDLTPVYPDHGAEHLD